MNETLDLGLMEGPMLIFGGPYSNIHALQALRAEAETIGIPPSQIICTGDIVGYCAYPDEALQFVRSWGIHSIAGNVELNLKEGIEDCGCNFESGTRCDLLSRQWYPFAQQNVSVDSLAYIHTLPHFIRFQYGGRAVAVVHGSVQNTSQFIFKSTAWSTKEAVFEQLTCDTVLAGHCGLAFDQTVEDRLWLNAGVIGMPANDASTDTWYLTLDDGKGFSYAYQRLGYDWAAAKDAMDSTGLVNAYAETLATGLWDSLDVLPEQEKRQTGQPLRF